jgi:hypothetical protein
VWGLQSRLALERGGDSPEGRVALDRGEDSPEGRATLERGGDSPEGACSPRARQRFARGVLRLAAEIIWAVCPSPHWAATTRGVICDLWVCLRFVILLKKGFFPGH